jgi:hypothetical protein
MDVIAIRMASSILFEMAEPDRDSKRIMGHAQMFLGANGPSPEKQAGEGLGA